MSLPQWWTMSGDEFMAALRRGADGDTPETVYAERYANSEVERPA